MKFSICLLLLAVIIFSACNQAIKNSPITIVDGGTVIVIDSSVRNSVEKNIQLISVRNFSQFKTPIEYRFFAGNVLEDSIIQKDFGMESWYSIHEDSIDIVAHVGELESIALLIRFINNKPSVFFFRASHSRQNYFRLSVNDTFTNQLEIPLIKCDLKLSLIPDTIGKPVVFGSVDMVSDGYFDKRDSVQQKLFAKMKFYFRSQYLKFDFE